MKKQIAYDDSLAHTLSLTRYVTLPAHEQIVDRLADLLFAADEALEVLRAEDTWSYAWVKPHIQSIYDVVNDLMKKLCD